MRLSLSGNIIFKDLKKIFASLKGGLHERLLQYVELMS
jgi:hypothetical protein